MRSRHRILLAFVFVLDGAIIAAVWPGAYWLRFFGLGWSAPRGVPHFDPYLRFDAFIVPVTLLVLRSLDLYGGHRTISGELATLARGIVITTVTVAVTSYFTRGELARSVLMIFGTLAVVALSASRIAVRVALRSRRRRGKYVEHALIVGSGGPALALARKMRDTKKHGVALDGLVAPDAAEVGQERDGVPIVGAVSDLPALVERVGADLVYIALSRAEYLVEEETLRRLSDSAANVHLVPDLTRSLLLNASVEDFDGTPVVSLTERPGESLAGAAKRLFDLVVSAVALILLAPLLAAVAAWIRLDSLGPALILQERVGLSGRTFPMMKFRTMRADAEAKGPGWTRPDDPRRTQAGALLRRFSLDELPQLWNVLVGQMSLVGPRPERPAFVDRFRASIPKYMLRHHVRAGMTGWAQVNGLRGDTPIDQRIEHDLFYITHWSFAFDLRILALTVARVFRDASAH